MVFTFVSVPSMYVFMLDMWIYLVCIYVLSLLGRFCSYKFTKISEIMKYNPLTH